MPFFESRSMLIISILPFVTASGSTCLIAFCGVIISRFAGVCAAVSQTPTRASTRTAAARGGTMARWGRIKQRGNHLLQIRLARRNVLQIIDHGVQGRFELRFQLEGGLDVLLALSLEGR